MKLLEVIATMALLSQTAAIKMDPVAQEGDELLEVDMPTTT